MQVLIVFSCLVACALASGYGYQPEPQYRLQTYGPRVEVGHYGQAYGHATQYGKSSVHGHEVKRGYSTESKGAVKQGYPSERPVYQTTVRVHERTIPIEERRYRTTPIHITRYETTPITIRSYKKQPVRYTTHGRFVSHGYDQQSYGHGQQGYGYEQQGYGYEQPSYGYEQPSYGYGH